MAKLVITGDKKQLEIIAKRSRTSAKKYNLDVELSDEPVKKEAVKKAVPKKEAVKKAATKKSNKK